MKTLFVTIFLLSVLVTASVDKKPKEFEVTFSVTYNSITLQKAAELEKIFKEKFGDACTININVKEANTLTIVSGSIDTRRWRPINDSLKITYGY